ncbi:MAG: CHAT domain-containing protein [Sporichthyaceae bacterium]
MLRPSVTGSDLHHLATAHGLLGLALRDPSAALRAAEALLADGPGPVAASIAHRAAGLALADLADVDTAVLRFGQAIDVAARHGLDHPAAQARMSLAVALANRGRVAAALRELDRAARVLRGVDRAEALAQRGLILGRAGRYAESMAAYRRALPIRRRHGNVRFEALALCNRGGLRSLRGDLRPAEADLRRCVELADSADLAQVRADAENNLGYLAACRGDLPAALAAFGRAERVPGAGPGQLAATWSDRASALLGVGLAAEAAADAARAAALSDRIGNALDAADARLILARALLADDDPTAAADLAVATALEFRRQGRQASAAEAMSLSLRARHAAGETGAPLLRAARASLAELERVSHRGSISAGRLLLVRMLIQRGRLDEASALLGPRPDGRDSAQARVAAWTAHALLHERAGDAQAARRGVRSGLAVLADFSAALHASDLRIGAAGDGRELAAIGVRLALGGGRPREVLRAAEALRARSLAYPPTRPPRDAGLAADLTALRLLDPDRLGARARLERSVRDRARAASARGARARALDRGALDLDAVGARLGDRSLVEYVRSGEDLFSVVLAAGRYRLHDLGAWAPIEAEILAARFAAHRLWRSTGTAQSRTAAHAALDHAAHALDSALLAGVPVDAGLVVVPTADLHALPWNLLPSTAGRPVQVLPSLTWWQRNPPAARSYGRVVLVAGPGLRHAAAEVRAIARRWPNAVVLTGRRATVAAVLAALDGADLAHLACHGRFRADHPDFSVLELADGALTVHDLHRVRRVPRLLVLSACEAARTAVRPGEELLGFAAALFGRGAQTLLAPATAVADRDAKALTCALHDFLSAGQAPATALARACAQTDVAAFTCFGGG